MGRNQRMRASINVPYSMHHKILFEIKKKNYKHAEHHFFIQNVDPIVISEEKLN